jgi:hypothetical protein
MSLWVPHPYIWVPRPLFSPDITLAGGGSQPAAAGGVFGTIWSDTLTSSGSGWNNFTIRNVYEVAGLTAPSGTPTQARVTFEANSGGGFNIAFAYIGHQASSGDAYDFDTTPTQITFDGGSDGKLVGSGSEEVSDAVNFAWDKTSDIVISMYCSGASTDDPAQEVTSANVTEYYKSGNDAATVNASSYTDDFSDVIGTNKIETDGF